MVAGAGPVSAQLFIHGSLIIVVASFIEPPLVLAGSRLAATLKNNQRIGQWMDRGLEALFISLGVRLANGGRDWPPPSLQAGEVALNASPNKHKEISSHAGLKTT